MDYGFYNFNDNITLKLTNLTTLVVYEGVAPSVYVPKGKYNVVATAKEWVTLVKIGGYNDWGEWVQFKISADKKTATLDNITMEVDVELDTIQVLVEQPPPPVESDGVSGFNHLYLVDKTILNELSKERFVAGVDDASTDLGSYITNLFELPFSVDESIKGVETFITLGANIIKTKAVELIDDELTLNLGSIKVPYKYNNSYDFMNTNIYLHLPFIPTIELKIEYVINETIDIKYMIDLFTGDCTVIVRSSKIDNNIIFNESSKIGKSLPFIKSGGDIIGSLQNNNGLNNKLYNAFIEVIRNKPYEIDNRFNQETSIQTKLINEKGYVIVNDIDLNTDATFDEQNTIINLLKSGVIIK